MLNTQQIQDARTKLGITPQTGGAAAPDRASTLQQAWGTPSDTPAPAVPTKDPFNPFPVKPVDTPNPINVIADQAKGGVDQMKQAIQESTATDANGKQIGKNPIETGLKFGSGAATLATSLLAPIFKPLSKIIDDATQPIQNNPSVQEFAESPAGQTTARVAEDVANLANIGGTVAGAKGIIENAPAIKDSVISTAKSITQGASDVLKSDNKQTTAVTTDPSEKGIIDNYTKAIKPTVVGKKSPQMLDNYNKNVVSGIQSIVENKDNLSFVNKDGEVETGRTPQTVGELTQAIDQTQAGIFDKYNALAKQTGEQGIQISADPVVSELDKVISNEAIQVSHPEAIREAEAIKSRIMDTNKDGSYGLSKSFDPEVVQNIIKGYNSSLEAFYRNPSYDSASRAAVAAGTVRAFRQALGEAIQKATGEDYSALKKQYGALSSIEADVAKRALVLARQSSATGSSGIADYAQIFAGGDMVHGLLSLNPALFAKGAAQAGLTKFFSYLKSPDRAIGKMFDAANSASTK